MGKDGNVIGGVSPPNDYNMIATRWTGDIIANVLWNLALRLGSKKGQEPALKVRPAPIWNISEKFEVPNLSPAYWLIYWLQTDGLLSRKFRLILYKKDGTRVCEWEGYGQNVLLPLAEDEEYLLYIEDPEVYPAIAGWPSG